MTVGRPAAPSARGQAYTLDSPWYRGRVLLSIGYRLLAAPRVFRIASVSLACECGGKRNAAQSGIHYLLVLTPSPAAAIHSVSGGHYPIHS